MEVSVYVSGGVRIDVGKMGREGGRKKVHEVEEAAGDDNSVHIGSLKRSKVGNKPRYGSENSTLGETLQLSRGMMKECAGALAVLAHMERRDAEEKALMVRREAEAKARRAHEEEGCMCQCLDRRGETMEDALELSDDEELEILAVTHRPMLVKNQPAIDCARIEVIHGAHLTAEDISGHQKNHKIGIFVNHVEESEKTPMEEVQTDKESCTSVDGDAVLCSVKAQRKEAKSVLKRLTADKALGLKIVKVGCLGESSTAGKRGRGKERDVDDEEGEDDLEGHMFGSPRHKKTRELNCAESVEDVPDFEVPVDSDSDSQPSPVIVDPFDEVWKQVALITSQSKCDDEQKQEGCAHTLETKLDVGKACSLCGLIKEDIKDLTFMWRRPCTIRQQPHARSMRANTWDGDGDEVLEEEARLFGMPPLEAHNSLEDAMHPHQLEGFKFLSKNLVEQDSGGCMLAFAPGTGKSFLIISFIHSFMRQVPNARPMIVAPKSMIRPWIQEFKKWQVEETTLFNLYEGVDDAAKVEILKLWQETRSVLLVGYAQCTNMSGEIGRYLKEGPGLMVLDEGHLARTETTKILKSLSRVHTKRRVLLSGTPFNNNFQEFYTTLELVRPNFMQRANVEMQPTLNALMPPEPKASEKVSPFLKRFSNAGRQAFKDAIGENLFESGKHHSITRALGQLRKLIEPFVAWHKGQILKTLPGITDLTIMLELTSKQRELLKNDNSEVRDNLQKRAAAIYLHPIVEPVSDGGKRSQNDPRLRGDNIDLKQGVKLRWVLDLVQLCDAAKEKVLIFSEYLYALELIENVAMHRMKWSKGSQILRIDGKMDIADRETSINKFNNDQDAKMMCASIKACGEGICLVGASRVVILEVVWNPSVTRQAISRAFRIGQQKKVVVYRLIAADTYEEHRMHATATRKEWLSKLLFDPSISCVDPNSILRDVTKDCNDMFLDRGPLRNGVKSIYEREFCG